MQEYQEYQEYQEQVSQGLDSRFFPEGVISGLNLRIQHVTLRSWLSLYLI